MVKKHINRILAGLTSFLLLCTCLGSCAKQDSAEVQGNRDGDDSTAAQVADNSNDDVKAKDMEALEALTFEEIAASNELSADDRENMVYRYVSDTVIVDTDKLVTVTDEEETALKRVVSNINNALCTGETTVISEDMLNYVLWEMANTPYLWEYSDMEIKGIDAATRLYFVDVTYRTTKIEKEVIPDSVIVRGSPNEETMKAKRYSDYLVWLDSIGSDSESLSKWQRLINSERTAADAMSVFAYGLQYDSIMDGYTADASSTNTQQTSTDTFIDSEGVVRDWTEYTFEDRWGSLDSIFATQDGITLVERLQEYNNNVAENADDTTDMGETANTVDETEQQDTANELFSDYDTDFDVSVTQLGNNDSDAGLMGVYTYGGLTEVAHDYGAEMTFRMVFSYTYSIGSDNTMKLQSLYLHDYNLNDSESLVDAYTTETIQSGEVLTPFISKTIKSYRKAMEESNHVGLYNLFVTYDKYDTYIADLLSYAYINNGGFTVEPIGRKGDEVAVIVTQRTQKRAKGTYMSMPTYQDTVLVKVKLCDDDQVRIVSVTTLTTTLIGEPLSIVRDVSGVSEQIAYDASAFTTSNAVAVEQAIGDFEKIQLNYNGTDLKADDYAVIDLGMASTEKTKMLEAFANTQKFNPNNVAVWLTSYETKSNLYVAVKLREVFMSDTGNLDIEATLGLINRNGVWKVISYTRTLMVPTSAVADLEGFKTTCLTIVDAKDAVYYNATEGKKGASGSEIDLSTDDTDGWDVEKSEEQQESENESSVSEETQAATTEKTDDADADDFFSNLF